ncbi:MAG: uroporphyrinogen-III synthase, partial [Helicobacteraceae bacterium]|nr:uroporphyrinogen-III synthase [Helicobacteraceae bacterium]
PNDAAIVFTSPSVVKSFFAQTAWQSGWRAIALGKSAAKALKPFAPCAISPQTDIDAAVAFAALAR